MTPAGAAVAERAGGRSGVPRWLRPAVITAGVLVLALAPLGFTENTYIQTVLILTLLLVVSSSGWNIISGFAGYVSLGQGAFIGVGAYTVGILSRHTDVSPFVLAPLGGVAAAALAAVLGLVAMRARGHAFVIITIAFLFLMQTLALNLQSITGGSAGITLPLPTWSRDIGELPFYYAMLALAVLSVALAAWIRRSKLGAGLLAIREDEGKAAAIGIRTPAYKLIGFVVSAVLIGIAGGIDGYFLTFIDPRGMFDILISVQIVLAALLGGRGTIWGPVLGAFLLQPLSEVVNNYFGTRLGIRLLVFGGLLALVVMLMPAGIIPTIRTAVRRWRERGSVVPFIEQPVRRAKPAAAAPPEEPAVPALAVRVSDREPVAERPPLLEIQGLSKRFGGLTALDGCSFSVREGTITGLLDLVGLGAFGDRTAGTLSFGQQKLVELAQVLMLEPKLIMLDEPAGGVNPSLIEHLADLIRQLNRDGISFLVVEHNMPLVLQLCDPVVVLAAGRCIAQGPPQAIQRDPEVLGAYLGGDGSATQGLPEGSGAPQGGAPVGRGGPGNPRGVPR